MTTLIGSKALIQYIPNLREPRDTDYFSETPVEGAEVFWHPLLANYAWGEVATLDELYTIKVSHAFWELHGTWNKHMFDVLTMQKHGAKLIPELYDILYKVWEDTHGKKKANLESDPEMFFNDKVIKRIYDHDSLHESVAYNERPLFEKILRDGSEVAVSRKKWEALSEEDKLNMVREEVYATALERWIVPSDYKYSPMKAYTWTLQKTITSLSKGWFPLFIVDNFSQLTKPDIDYVERHKQNSHKLRPYK